MVPQNYMMGRCGLIAEIIEAPRSSGTHKNTRVLWGFYATGVDVYCITLKQELLKPNLT